jgi:branched-chain amino acid transport system ATP-binding protein
LLEVRDITVSHGRLVAVDGMSFHVREGEFVSLLGSNGAGKTTLMKTLAGLYAPQAGNITFAGADLSGRGAQHAVEAGLVLVPEGRMVFPDMSILENLLLGAVNPRAKPNRARTLERVFTLFPKLAERQAQMARTLSGGEQQMLAIGRGLMAQPRMLMLDEPSLGLSPLLVQESYAALARLNAEGLTILLAEQNVQLSLRNSTRGYVVENGRIALEGSAQWLLESPETRRAFLGL